LDKAIAYVVVSDDIAYYLAERVENSFKHFHDLPFKIVTAYDAIEIFGNVPKTDVGSWFANLSIKMLEHYLEKYETVIKLDADVVITSRLDEFLDKDYDIACSLNCKGVPGIDYVKYPDYCNLGVTAVRSKEFAREWAKLAYDRKFIEDNEINYSEQGVMNFIAFNGKYKTLVVDKEDCYYNETGRADWDKIKIRHKGLFIGDRQVKAMHWAGGGELGDKYNWPSLPADVKKFLNEITKTKDFV
jgi:hypothetical protein